MNEKNRENTSIKINNSVLLLTKGDITKQQTDAIVNAANSGLMGGGGVDGAIHRAGGPQILKDCKNIVSRQGRLPTGDAVITTAGNLPAKYVIHTVGPVWYGGNKNEPKLLRNAYWNSLKLAEKKGLNTISFPSISTGVYAYPIERAAAIALEAVTKFMESASSITNVVFVLFDQRTFGAYREALENIKNTRCN